MKKNKRNLRKKENTVNLIVSPHRVQRWVLLKKRLAVLIKIVINKFAFLGFLSYN